MRGKPAQLKNDKVITRDKTGKVTGVSKSRSVVRYLSKAATHFTQQREAQGFDPIPMPLMVGVIAQLHLYTPPSSKLRLPTADNDNLWTTVQEAMQHGVVFEDDRQVRDPHPYFVPARARQLEHIALFVFTYEGDPLVDGSHLAAMQWILSDQNPLRKLA